tara:strand:- start:106 stop:285 length:180 start_codon:yes stop_codon:yes gene_type:complete
MTVTRKELQEEIKHLTATNGILAMENTKLKDIIQVYENYIFLLDNKPKRGIKTNEENKN